MLQHWHCSVAVFFIFRCCGYCGSPTDIKSHGTRSYADRDAQTEDPLDSRDPGSGYSLLMN